MHRCVELAGFAAAQAVCCLFDRQPFLPLAFTCRAPDQKSVSILSGGSSEAMGARAREWLDANPEKADAAVVAMDGYITIPPSTRTDAIILEIRGYREHAGGIRMAVPYRPHHDRKGFAVHRPKLMVATLEGQDGPGLQEAFVRGVCSHEYGGRIWQACFDDSR